jgi:hypothetical protein
MFVNSTHIKHHSLLHFQLLDGLPFDFFMRIYFQIFFSLYFISIEKIHMSSLVDILPIIQLPAAIPLRQLSPKNDDNDKRIDQLLPRYEQSRLIDGNGRREVLVQKDSVDISGTRKKDYTFFSIYSSTLW